MDAGRSAVRRIQFGPIECLEPRLMLSYSPHARIVNGVPVSSLPLGIVNGVPTEQFSAVGMVGDRSVLYCTGTLIAPRFVLTAGHCAEGLRPTQGRFAIAGSLYSSSAVFVHPSYNGNRIGSSDAANDIAILELSTSVAGITPDLIFRGVPHVTDLLTLVGFGAGGTGTTGHDGSFGLKRAGTTPIDNVTQRRVLWNFDNNHESNTAPGDSGGPAYLQVSGVYYVAGITSGGDRSDAGIGDHSYDTRVDYYAQWIDTIVGTTGTPPNPGSDPGFTGDDHADSPGSDATVLTIGWDGAFFGTGNLETVGDRDAFSFDLSQRGTVSLDLASIDGTVDTYLRVYDGLGNLVSADDDSGPGTDSHLNVILSPGVYYVTAGAFNDAAVGSYRLDGRFSLDDHADSFVGATPISLSSGGTSSATGTIGHTGDRDMFRFVATVNAHVAFDLAGTGGLDPVLTVLDRRGRVLGVNDDSLGTTDSHLLLRVRAGSTYYIQAAGFQASQGGYSLTLTRVGGSRLAARSSAGMLFVGAIVHEEIDRELAWAERGIADHSGVWSLESPRRGDEPRSESAGECPVASVATASAPSNVAAFDHVIADEVANGSAIASLA